VEEYREIKLSKGQIVKVSLQDFDELSKFKWSAKWDKGSFYASRNIFINGKKTRILMHRQIMGDPQGFQVDHVHGDTLDNRRSELRLATGSQNQWNTKMRSDNSSGFKGVSRHTATGRWQSKISAYKKRTHLGYFDTAQEAHEAYCAAAAEYHGEFRRIA
jgi:hypothetical protein